jgi:hypothetical protein
MTHPQVLSKEKIEQLAREHAGDPSCSSPWGNTFEFEPSELRSFTRAIESATLEAMSGQAFGFVWRQKGSEDQWRFCQDVTQAADAVALSNTEIQLVYARPSPTQPPAQQEPFGYFKATPFGWIDCASTDDGAVALYERPQKSA